MESFVGDGRTRKTRPIKKDKLNARSNMIVKNKKISSFYNAMSAIMSD